MVETPLPKLTIIASHLHPVLGTERVLLNLLGALHGVFDMEVVCIGGNSKDIAEFDRVRVLGKPLRGVRRLGSFYRLLRFRRTIPASTVTVVVGVWAAIPWLIVGGPRLGSTVIWEHSLISEKVASSRGLRLLSVLAPFVYRRAHSVVAVSQPLADDLKAMRLKRVATIPNIVTAPDWTSEFENKTNGKLLVVGSLSATKRTELAIQALKLLPSGYTLSVIGEGPNRAALASFAAESGVEQKVQFLGHLPSDSVGQLMSESELLLHCAAGETFGVVFVEAATRGLPVVATRNRVSSVMIPQFAPGRLAPSDPREIAEEIQRLRRLPPSAAEFSAALRSIHSTFGAERVARSWTDLIASIPVQRSESRSEREV